MGTSRRRFFYGLLATAGLGFGGSKLIFKLPVFGKETSGDRLKRIQASPNWRNGAFQNLEPVNVMTRPERKDASRRSWLTDFFFGNKDGREPSGTVSIVETDLSLLPQDSLVWLGHSTYLMRIAGFTVLIDPVFHAATPFPEIPIICPFKGTEVYSAEDMPVINVLVITHDHYDHLDYDAVKTLRTRVKQVICPLGVGAILEGWGYDREKIKELDWFERTELGELSVTALPGQHFSGRTLTRNQTLWCGFMFSTMGKNIYLSGDGGYGKHFTGIRERFGEIELAILENGQYNEDWSKIHLMPDDLTEAVRDLSPKFFMTGHHAKFCLSKHHWAEPMENEILTEQKVSSCLLQPPIGRIVSLKHPDTAKSYWWRETN